MFDNQNRAAVEALGYTVSIAYNGPTWSVWSVEGFGVLTSIRHDDNEAWLQILQTHDERNFQVTNIDAMFAAMAVPSLERLPGDKVWTDSTTNRKYTPAEVIALAKTHQSALSAEEG